jgi:hypothetical protein
LFLSFIFRDCKCVIVESWLSSTLSSLPVSYDFASRAHLILFSLITLILFTYKLLKAVLRVFLHTRYLFSGSIFFRTRYSYTHKFFP